MRDPRAVPAARRKNRLDSGAGDVENDGIMSDYDRIARAIDFLVANADAQPGLREVAAEADLSPWHFQRLFARWVGVTPKRFLQVLTVERAKRLLAEGAMPVLDASEHVGLSSVSRLYDHFVQLEAVTPGEYRRQGQGLTIRYGPADGPFGRSFIAWTDRGICRLAFMDSDTCAAELERLCADWPGARVIEDVPGARDSARRVFARPRARTAPLSVLVRGTNFQVAVWRALLSVPAGRLVSYGDVARAIGRPAATRAVGTAVGANPCAFLIPCHRVIRESGELGGYRWGLTRKQVINAWEAAMTDGMLPECRESSPS